jgi:hypothetical protein
MEHDYGYGQYIDLEHYAGRVIKHYIPINDHTVIQVRQMIELPESPKQKQNEFKDTGAQRYKRYQSIYLSRPSNKINADKQIKNTSVSEFKVEMMQHLLSTICIVLILITQLWFFHR